MNRDPKGFYKRLGLTPSATQKQIKETFRQLAKQYHPDLNNDPNAKQAFQAINEAYEALCESEKRAKYDSSGYEAEAVRRQQETEDRPPPEPIKCSCCGKATAQPRYVVYWKITSFIFVSTRTPIQGIFCKQCADSTALKASIYSALFGWWSVHGVFLTPVVILRNALGGRQDKDNNDRLAFANATIFFRRGQFELAYALASPLRTSAVDRFNEGSRLICQIIEREQLADTSRKLRSQWGFKYTEFIKNIVPGMAVVAIVVGFVFFDQIAMYLGGSVSQLAVKPAFSTAGLTPLPTNPRPSSMPKLSAPACDPASGTILGGYYRKQDEGHSIEIRNGNSNPAIVKLKDVSGRTYLSFYVKRSGTAEVRGLRDGVYKIQFAHTDGLAADCSTMNTVLAVSEFPAPEALITKYSGNYIEWVRMTYTLHNVAGGNVRPKSIDIGAF